MSPKSNIKSDLLKQIEAKVARKKELAKEVSREKTIVHWVSEFFTEFSKTRKLDPIGYMAVQSLTARLRKFDRKVDVVFKVDSETIEIRWSSQYLQDNNCEDHLVFDASSAHFQSAMETL